MTVRLAPLPPGPHRLDAVRPGPDLAAAGYEEVELVASGEAVSYRGTVPPDGRAGVEPDAVAPFATRVLVRRPPAGSASGTLLVEWLNVSSGRDVAPDWAFTADEVVRSGHAWAGVSAQYAGVEGAPAAVDLGGPAPLGLRGEQPDRYGDLHHPGDAFAYDLFTQVAAACRDLVGADVVLAVGESQSATCLTTYVDAVHPLARLFDGFLVHSRLAGAAPLGRPGEAISMATVVREGPVLLRDDLDVPVLVVQAEGDLFDRIGFLPARQPDTDRLRLWEVAGSAHADKYVVGDFEELLGCAVPVSRGQQWAVLRAAVRHLDRWARGGDPPPSFPRLEVDGDRFVLDEHGLARGGVRTPVVDAPVEVLSGRAWPGAGPACQLFGSTTPLAAPPYGSPEEYLERYAAATDDAVARGVVLPDDRDAVLAEARPDLVPVSAPDHPRRQP